MLNRNANRTHPEKEAMIIEEAIANARKEYEEYLEIAQIAKISIPKEKIQEPERTWDYPLSLVLRNS